MPSGKASVAQPAETSPDAQFAHLLNAFSSGLGHHVNVASSTGTLGIPYRSCVEILISMDGTSPPASEAGPERDVHIVMVPIKDIGSIRKAFVKILMHSMGYIATVGWVMHWALLTEDTCFELQRYPVPPYTRLKASRWDGSRNAEVLHRMAIGKTRWKNEEIEDVGTKYFQRNVNVPYDLYINNCQTFVNHLAYEMCSDDFPKDKLIAIPIQHILSYAAARLYTIFAVPLMRLWYRLRGVDEHILVEFEHMSAFWGYSLLPSTLQQPMMLFPIMIADLRKRLEDTGDEKQLSKPMRYATAVFSSFLVFGYIVSQPVITFWASQPRVKKYPDGIWRMRYRPNRVPTMDAGGKMKFEELGAEVPPGDSTDLTDEDGRFLDSKNVVIPTWFWVVWGVSGFVLATAYWSYRLGRRLVRLVLGMHG